MDDANNVTGRTYNYLRLSMVGVLAALFVALGMEWLEASGCFQKSISAYYYTPVQLVFVGALVALGVGMVVLWGRNAVEDAFLNLAGLFAPVVAFVPTAKANRCSVVTTLGVELDQGSVETARQADASRVVEGAQAAINNNMWAFFVVVLIGLLAMAMLRRPVVVTPTQSGPEMWPYRLSYVLAVIAWIVGVLAFLLIREDFYDKAHGVSAVLLFLCIIVVVFASANQRATPDAPGGWTTMSRRRRLTKTMGDRYALLGLAMIGSIVGIVGYNLTIGFTYWVLALEATLIALFLVFWILQTREHWWAPSRPADSDAEAPTLTPRG